MQLPREQLKELIDKQPSIKPALYQYVVQKAGVAKAQSLADVSGPRLKRSIVLAMYASSLFCHDSSLATFLKLIHRNNPSLQSPEVSTRYHGITNDFCNENILVVHIYSTHRSISKCLSALLAELSD